MSYVRIAIALSLSVVPHSACLQVKSELDAIALRVHVQRLQRRKPDISELETVHIVRQVMFEDLKFTGDSVQYYDARNRCRTFN